MAAALHLSLYKNRTFADVTFLFDGNQVRAHKAVLADRCDHFKQFFEQDRRNVITMNDTYLKIFDELVKYCYLQQIDIVDWSSHDKQRLYELASAYNYGSLMDIVKRERDKRPEVPLSVDTLNEWYVNSPGEELRGWIKNNILNIANYEDCHEYSKDLIHFILDTFNEMFDKEKNKYKLRAEQKQLLLWLFRWRNLCTIDEEDVRGLLLKIRLPLVLQERTLRPKTLQRKSSIETNDGFKITPKYEKVINNFVLFRKLDTIGWTCDEILQLLGCANELEFGPLFDAVLNVVATQYLEPASFAAIYDITHELESEKLQQILVAYLRNNTNSIFNSAEFTKYPARVVVLILDNLSDQVMEVDTKLLIFTSIKKWLNSSGKKQVKKVNNNVKCHAFVEKIAMDLFIRTINDDDSKDVTFVFGKQEIKAHKTVLGHSCNYFKQLFDQNKNNQFNMEGTCIEPFKQLIKHCYMQKIDLTGWGFSDKIYLFNLASQYNCRSLTVLLKMERQKRPTVPLPLGVESLNEWYEHWPDEIIREWVKNNQLRIVNYENCHKYSKDLVVLIMDTFFELSGKATDKEKLETPLKKLPVWLFRWRNSAIRKEDVQSLFEKINFPLLLKDRALRDKTLQKKLFEAVRRFCHTSEVDTAGWTCDDVLELLFVAFDNEFGPLVDAVVNVVATQHLQASSLGKIHELTSRLQCNKLQQIIVDYIRNHTMTILTSAEFIRYPASLVVFILENMRGQVMDVNVKNQLLTSLWTWKTSKSEDELKAVFTKIQWKDFSRNQLAAVLHLVIPVTCLADISCLPAAAEGKGAKRKQSDNSQDIRSVHLRKE